MLMVLLATSLVGFQLTESTPRADWYISAPKLKVDVRECETFLAETEKEFGVKVPRFNYRRIQLASEVSVLAEVYAGGTVIFNQDEDRWEVISDQPCSKHEIVHLITAQIGWPDPVFEEGLATMLAEDNGWLDRHNAKNDARWLLQVPPTYASIDNVFRRRTGSVSEHWREYLFADGWVRDLRDRDGMDCLVEFLQTQAKVRDSHTAFYLVYLEDLDASFERWLYGKKGPPKPKARHR